MKSMFAAAVLAVIIHIIVLLLFESLMPSKKDILTPTPNIITVTMSYRQSEKQKKPADITRKKPVFKKTIKPKKPEIVPEALTRPDLMKPGPIRPDQIKPEKEKIPVTEKAPLVTHDKKTVEDVTESDQKSATYGSSVSNITSPVEAVPLYKINPPPIYPRVAIKRGYQGTVELMVLVNKNGEVADLWLFESSGYTILDQSALKTVQNWSFTPGRLGNREIEMWVRVPVRFQLQ